MSVVVDHTAPLIQAQAEQAKASTEQAKALSTLADVVVKDKVKAEQELRAYQNVTGKKKRILGKITTLTCGGRLMLFLVVAFKILPRRLSCKPTITVF